MSDFFNRPYYSYEEYVNRMRLLICYFSCFFYYENGDLYLLDDYFYLLINLKSKNSLEVRATGNKKISCRPNLEPSPF